MSQSALVIEVPEAEEVVGPWREVYDRAAETGIPAHITLLFPFAPAAGLDEPLLAELESFFAGHGRIEYRLARVARFPRYAWLAPEPVEPFVDLTRALVARYPQYPRYGGEHGDDIVPHLTVAEGDADVLAEAEAAVAPSLPIDAAAGEVALLAERPNGRWFRRASFPLGDA